MATTIKLTFTPTSGDSLKNVAQTPAGNDPLSAVRGMIDPKLAQALAAAEPRVMAWLRASKDNVTQFTADPLGALKAALPDFDPALIAQIASIRAAAVKAAPTPPRFTLDSLTADVAPEAT